MCDLVLFITDLLSTFILGSRWLGKYLIIVYFDLVMLHSSLVLYFGQDHRFVVYFIL